MGCPNLSHLQTIDLSQNPLSSLKGFPTFKSLQTINVEKTPFAKHQYYRIALIILCNSLRVINGDRITASERNVAHQYSSEFIGLIRSGWIPTYPPPKAEQMSKIRAEISSQLTASVIHRDRPLFKTANSRRSVKKQSILFSEEIAQQNAEIEELEKEIAELQQQHNVHHEEEEEEDQNIYEEGEKEDQNIDEKGVEDNQKEKAIKDINNMYREEIKDIIDFSESKISDDISFSPKKKRKKNSSKSKSNKTLNSKKKSSINSLPKEQYISGPIITFLKKTVDDYNRKSGKKILM